MAITAAPRVARSGKIISVSAQDDQPFIVGIGGTAKAASSTEQALAIALAAAQAAGARTQIVGSDLLTRLPHYLTADYLSCAAGVELVALLRKADGLIIASPGYHGSISGLVKNALDYAEETARDARVYFDGLPIGVIATAYGWQAGANTLGALRTIVHSLRAYPTPYGAVINSALSPFRDGACSNDQVSAQLQIVGMQVTQMARMARNALRDASHSAG